MNCPGSIRLREGVEERPSQYAEEGTRAHELLEALLWADRGPVGHLWAQESKDRCETASEEMYRGAELAVNYALDLEAQGGEMLIEHQGLVPSQIAPGEVGGTVDVMIYLPSIKTLHVIDFKYGAGVAVEVKGNKQLRVYGVQGINSDFGWIIEKVVLTIIQPRAFHPDGPIRSEELSVADLLDFHADIETAVDKALDRNVALIPGDKQCRWCPAASFCPARETQALAVVGDSFGHIQQVTKEKLPVPSSLSPARLGQILAAKDLVDDWLEAVQAEAYKFAMSGGKIPGQKLVQSISKRQWSGEIWAIAGELSDASPGSTPENYVERKLIGIIEAEKLLKPYGKKALEVMKTLTTKPPGKLQLASENDKRPAVDPASQAFKEVVQVPQITGATE